MINVFKILIKILILLQSLLFNFILFLFNNTHFTFLKYIGTFIYMYKNAHKNLLCVSNPIKILILTNPRLHHSFENFNIWQINHMNIKKSFQNMSKWQFSRWLLLDRLLNGKLLHRRIWLLLQNQLIITNFINKLWLLFKM